MKIKVLYFAAMRDQAGKSEEIYETRGLTVRDVFSELRERYNFSLDEGTLKVAINEEYKDFTHAIKDMDTIVFIPPVAGG